MPQVRISAKLYAYISAAWVELDDVQPWSADWGIAGNGPLDFVADTGELKFRLNNSTGQYTPGGPSALAGWARGLPVKLEVTYDGETYVRFRGYIDDIDIRPANRDKTVSVTALDWLDYAARHPIVNPGILTSKRGNEVVDIMLAEIETPPQQTAFETGTAAFNTVFDTVTSSTSVYSEASKVALSEIAYIYLRKDKAAGETLVMENADTRHGWVTPGQIPLASADSSFALNEDGDFELNEDGDFVLLDETAAVTFSSSVIEDFSAPYGDAVVNQMKVIAHPRRQSASPEILFQLDGAIEIGTRPLEPESESLSRVRSNYARRRARATTNVVLEGTWADPQGGSVINAMDLITPVITTDYLMNTAEDGSGTDISSDLEIEITFGAEGFIAILANNSTAHPLGYITKFNVRGTGIFDYNPVEHSEVNISSIMEHEAQSAALQQRYRNKVSVGKVYARSTVEEYGDPRTRLEWVSFCANKSSTLMMAFLHTDVGDLRTIDIDELGISQNYYIQRIEATYSGGNIWVKWYVKEAPSLQGGFTDIAVEFRGAGSGDAVDFGYLPRVSGNEVTERTFAAWIYLEDITVDIKSIIAAHSDSGGVTLWTDADGITFYSNRHNVSPGTWLSGTTNLTADTWYHVVATYNHTNIANDPVLYINGTLQTPLNEVTSPAGTLTSEVGTHTVVGNTKTLTINYTEPFDGKIADARIYDRIITAAEALELYNGGTPDPTLVTDGLVFQAFAVRTDKISEFVDVALTEGTKIFDNVYKAAGNCVSEPIGRAAP